MKLVTPLVPMSWGELLDKQTILEIKGEKLESEQARNNVLKELSLLNDISKSALVMHQIESLKIDLLSGR